MDIWRLVEILYIVALANCHSDPLEIPQGSLFDESAHVPGEPLTPTDFENAVVADNSPAEEPHSEQDPIELAGLFEGDIILPGTLDQTNLSESWPLFHHKNAIISERKKWPGGIVPYTISSSFSSRERSVIARAIAAYHENTCIKFRPRSTERDYVYLTKGNGCSSLVGRSGGGQPVSLGGGCVYNGIVIHELMHAVGFWHEQSRWDRDDYVTVFPQNIQRGMEFNFRKYDWKYIQNLGTEYDLGSVMHYGPYAFSKDRRKATILPKDPNQKIGQRRYFSKSQTYECYSKPTYNNNDITKINKLYKCDASPVTPPPPPTPSTSCSDNHKHCKYWAGKGECSKNSAWMHVNCKKSCKLCGKSCRDLNQYCGAWAKLGDCRRNSDYMIHYCAKSCHSCRT